MDKHLLTFEYDTDNERLEIHADLKGLIFLREQIDSLIKEGGSIHLMTPNWGGDELSMEKQGPQNILLNHVKMFCWSEFIL